jgi:hypothetical protein
MLKSSSLCLYSSKLGTFWLKIEQFWPFEEISIFSNGGHLGYRTALTDTIFERDPLRDHPCQVWSNLVQQFQRRRFKCDLLSKYAQFKVICIIGINRLKEKFQTKTPNIC